MADRKVLVVEDEEGIRKFVRLELQHEGFDVVTAETGREALSVFEQTEPVLVLLDIMLPELSGLEVLRRIRKTSDVPVILVTARGETYDKVNGLNAGADDYIAKPFEIEELLARMRAVLRRDELAVKHAAEQFPSSGGTLLVCRKLMLNTNSMDVSIDGVQVELSRTEYLLLKFLLEHRNTVFSRDQIIEAVWGREHYIEENAVDVYVGYLRSKIDHVAGEEYITTVRGAGYIIRDAEADA